MKRVIAGGFVLLTLAACADPVSTPSAVPDGADMAGQAPALGLQDGQPIAGSYIVVLKDAPGLGRAAEVARGLGVSALRHEYNSALKGFAANMSDADAVRIARDPRVAYVEQDQVVSMSTTQTGATWGIDRIDQRNLPLSGSFTYENTGSSVTAYIIDTGIMFGHSELRMLP